MTFTLYVCSQQRRVLLTAEAASEVYEQHMLKLFFPTLLQYISSGPVLVLQLAREKAVSYLQEICGPTNPLRARITHPNWSVLRAAVRMASPTGWVWEL